MNVKINERDGWGETSNTVNSPGRITPRFSSYGGPAFLYPGIYHCEERNEVYPLAGRRPLRE
jgi:hypothetical protein